MSESDERKTAQISLADLDRDPYPLFAQLRDVEPIIWSEQLNMWLVLKYEHVNAILRDNLNFVVGTDRSLILDTFGDHMLTTDGEAQERHKRSFRGFFAPARVRAAMTAGVKEIVNDLISGFQAEGQVELRSAFAARLPVLAILALFGFPASAEPRLRKWYDAFEAALANFEWSEKVRAEAKANVAQFHGLIQEEIDARRAEPRDDILSAVLNDQDAEPLTDEEIKRNASIIFFGGISTVEALIMNAVYALCSHPEAMARVQGERGAIPLVIEETMRWLSPVQSATRHVPRAVESHGVRFEAGDTVNCMLGAANRDPAIFERPDQFSLDRPNVRRHLGFASGPHFCLGSHLAKLETEIALEALLTHCPDFYVENPADIEIRGHEFRQPKQLNLVWRPR